MRSRASPRLSRILPFLALALLLYPRWLYAAPLRAVVRVASAEDKALLDRLHGQSADLDLDLIDVPLAPMEPGLRSQLATADRLASERRARVVVWFTLDAPRDVLLVNVWVPATDRLLTRPVAAPREERSAVFEQAAFVVRAALQAIAANVVTGVSREQALREAEGPPPPAVPAAPPATSPGPVPKPSRPPDRAPLPGPPSPARRTPPPRFVSALGWELGANGDFLAQGPAVRAGLEGRSWELGVGARFGLPVTSEGPLGTARRVEHALVASGGLAFDLSPTLRLCACADAGVAVFRRDTVATASGTAATPGRWLFSPLVGLRARATYRRRVGRGLTLGLGLEVGADALLAPPKFEFVARQDGSSLSATQLWPVEPRGALVVEIVTP